MNVLGQRPALVPFWGTPSGMTNSARPDGAHETFGWAVNEPPSSSFFNYLMNSYFNWITYADDAAQSRIALNERWEALGAPNAVATSYGFANGAQLALAPKWAFYGTGATGPGAFGVVVNEPYGFYSAPSISLETAGQTATTRAAIASVQRSVATGASGLSQVVQADIGSDEITAANGVEVKFGLSVKQDPFAASGLGFAWFRRAAGSSGWVAEISPTGITATTVVACGVPPHDGSTSFLQQMRVEQHSTGSPYGSCSIFKIDNAIVATGPQLSRSAYVVAGARCATGGIGGNLIQVGEVTVASNRR